MGKRSDVVPVEDADWDDVYPCTLAYCFEYLVFPICCLYYLSFTSKHCLRTFTDRFDTIALVFNLLYVHQAYNNMVTSIIFFSKSVSDSNLARFLFRV